MGTLTSKMSDLLKNSNKMFFLSIFRIHSNCYSGFYTHSNALLSPSCRAYYQSRFNQYSSVSCLFRLRDALCNIDLAAWTGCRHISRNSYDAFRARLGLSYYVMWQWPWPIKRTCPSYCCPLFQTDHMYVAFNTLSRWFSCFNVLLLSVVVMRVRKIY